MYIPDGHGDPPAIPALRGWREGISGASYLARLAISMHLGLRKTACMTKVGKGYRKTLLCLLTHVHTGAYASLNTPVKHIHTCTHIHTKVGKEEVILTLGCI